MLDTNSTGYSEYSSTNFLFAEGAPKSMSGRSTPRPATRPEPRAVTPPSATPRAARERHEIARLASAIESGGTFFILGVMALQLFAPLSDAELAWRVILAGWGVTAFRLVQTPGSKSFVLHLLIQMLTMVCFAFGDTAMLSESQRNIDVALISAGWVALFSRIYVLLAVSQLRSRRGDVALERHRRRIARAAAAR